MLLDLAISRSSDSESDDAQQDSLPEYQSTKPPCPFSFLLSHMLGFHSLSRSAVHSVSKLDNALLSPDTPTAFCVQLLD